MCSPSSHYYIPTDDHDDDEHGADGLDEEEDDLPEEEDEEEEEHGGGGLAAGGFPGDDELDGENLGWPLEGLNREEFKGMCVCVFCVFGTLHSCKGHF